jgi:predicted dienelactone hydrolase
MIGRRGRALLGVLVIGALVMGAAPATAGDTPAGPTRSFDVTFVDEARGRELPTTITFPADPEDPVPLLVLAHGNNGHPSTFVELMDAWAQAGYVVAAPAFPSDGPGDVRGQVEDMSFVIDEVLALSEQPGSDIKALVDERHIGAAGLSLGGGTVYGLVFNTCCRDQRIDAVVLMSTLRVTLTGSKEKFPPIPTMMIAGDADPVSNVTVNTYPLLAPPKWKVMLHGGTHSDPFEDTPAPADEVVRQITTAFWDRYLKKDKPAAKRIDDALAAYCDADLERELKSGASEQSCGREGS